MQSSAPELVAARDARAEKARAAKQKVFHAASSFRSAQALASAAKSESSRITSKARDGAHGAVKEKQRVKSERPRDAMQAGEENELHREHGEGDQSEVSARLIGEAVVGGCCQHPDQEHGREDGEQVEQEKSRSRPSVCFGRFTDRWNSLFGPAASESPLVEGWRGFNDDFCGFLCLAASAWGAAAEPNIASRSPLSKTFRVAGVHRAKASMSGL